MSTHDPSKTRAVVPGKAILGAKAAEINRKTLGGSVVPGKAVLGEELARREQEKVEAARKAALVVADDKAKAGPKAKPPEAEKRVVTAAGPAKAKDPKAPAGKKKAAPTPAPSLTEEEVQGILEADPNDWERVLTLEQGRTEFRVTTAQALLEAAALADQLPMPEEMIAQLQLLAAPAAE